MLLDFINQGGSLHEIYQCTRNSPDMLVEELQKYIQAGYIYIPAKDDQHKSWGELTGSRKEIDKRNKVIIEKYRNGVSVNELANEYCLSIYAIRKIIYQN